VVDFTVECEWLGRVTANIRARFCAGVKRGRGSAEKWIAKMQNAILALKRGGGIWRMCKQTFSSHCLALALGLCLVVAGSPALGAEHKFDGDYSGKRMLTKGSADPNCPAEDDVSVTIHGEVLTFTNSAYKNVSLGFYPRPDGSFHQTFTGAGGSTSDIVGLIIGDVIEADVNNPPCKYRWHVEKATKGK